MGRRNRTGAAPCHCKRQDIKCGFARKARSGQGKIDMAAATRSGLWILVWCFAAVHGYMPVEFYGGLLGRSLAGPGPPMPWEGRFKKRRRFGTSCRRASWSGSRPRPPGVSKGLMKTTFFQWRLRRNRGISTRAGGGRCSVSRGSSFHWPQGLPPPPPTPCLEDG